MTDIIELFSGIGIIIDDALNIENEKHHDDIFKIKKNLEKKGILLLTFSSIPDNHQMLHLKNINFILLDWELTEVSSTELFKDNIEFLIEMKKISFCPIFIFSKNSPDYIKPILIENGLYVEDKCNYIFVKQKSDLLRNDQGENDENLIFTEIEKWVKSTASVYVLKEWERSLNNAKRDLFWDFYNISPNWVKILNKTYDDDGTSSYHELSDCIYKNIIARTTPSAIDKSIFETDSDRISKDEIRKVLEGTLLLKNERLPDNPFSGDVFKEENPEAQTGFSYFINIRPDCDILRKSNPVLYCLKGRVIDEGKINSEHDDSIIFDKGSFREKICSTYVSFIDEGKIIEFLFNDIKPKKWNDLKNKRIGRLLPPYITKLQQRFAFYLHRQGIPGIPEEAIIEADTTT
jgi:hypothetical protein